MHLQTIIWIFFNVSLGVMASLLSSCRYWICFIVDHDSLSPVSASIFTRCFAFVDGVYIWHQSTFMSGTQNQLPSWALWWLDILMVFILAHNCLKINAAPPDSWRPTIIFLISWLISFDFPMLSHKEEVPVLQISFIYLYWQATSRIHFSHLYQLKSIYII